MKIADPSCPPSVLIKTLGCKVNRYDSDRLAAGFARFGFQVGTDQRAFDGTPDIVVVNTCCVTHTSERKCRQMIRKFGREYPDAKIIATGCAAELETVDLSRIGELDEICRIGEQSDLAERIAREFGRQEIQGPPPILPHERTRAFLKVQEGCDLFCTYCSVPFSRGAPRSRPMAEVKEEIKSLVRQGFREVVLCGTRLGWYGRDLGIALPDLLQALAKTPGLLRLRLSSLEPEDFGQRIIDIFAREPVLCPHLHLPLQSGSNCILERMGRKYRRDDYLRLIEQAHRQIADLCVSTDIMVGFPGESEDDFQETLSIVERCGFSKVHSFSFSIRPGTRAADMPEQVPFPVARQRRELLDRFALAKAEETRRKLLGRTMPVLVETCKNGVAEGLTPNYLRVRFPGKSGVTPNTVADVILKKASGLMVEGENMDEHGSTGTDKTED